MQIYVNMYIGTYTGIDMLYIHSSISIKSFYICKFISKKQSKYMYKYKYMYLHMYLISVAIIM